MIFASLCNNYNYALTRTKYNTILAGLSYLQLITSKLCIYAIIYSLTEMISITRSSQKLQQNRNA